MASALALRGFSSRRGTAGGATLLAASLLAACALPAGARAAEPFGLKRFEAGTCVTKTCTYETVRANPAEAYTQADGHPPFGITVFEMSYTEPAAGKKLPIGHLKSIRVDLPRGFSVNPDAVVQCAKKSFEEGKCPPESKVGEDEVTFANSEGALTPVVFPIYNLIPEPGLPLEVGIEEPGVHGYLKGYVSWYGEPGAGALLGGFPTGDYHEYFTTELPDTCSIGLCPVSIKQTFEGNKAGSGFLRLPSECNVPAATTSYARVESYEGAVAEGGTTPPGTTPPIVLTGCETPPFAPTAAVHPSTTQSDAPDGATVEVGMPHNAKATEVDSSDLRDSTITLPEGMTLNPAAAAGLEGCTPAQAAIGKSEAVSCPGRSRVGSVTIDVPQLPVPLTGSAYLGAPAGGAITGPPYTLYLSAEAPQFGVGVRLAGEVRPSPETGRLETRFLDNPALPFSTLKLTFNGGPLAPMANPLRCGAAGTSATFTPYTGFPATFAPAIAPFTVDANGAGAPCGAPRPFASPGLAQSTGAQPPSAGQSGSFTLALARAEGEQYVSGLRTVLPPGVVGLIPAVSQCAEAQAAAGVCGPGSQVGTVTVTAGSGSQPFSFAGSAYLTSKLDGAPFGLSIVVPAVAGPFDLGTIVTLATIQIDPHTANVIVTPVESELVPAGGGAPAPLRSPLPTIVGGIPTRIRSITVTMSRQGFMRNPTNCGPLAATSTLTGTEALPPAATGAATLTSPFAVEGCAALPFTPSFAATTNARSSRLNGASLDIAIGQRPGEANIRSVVTTLPYQLPSRNSTLQKACLQATFEANPSSCPRASLVGSATVMTPALPVALKGPAYIVSHGGAAFPDLDLVLSGSGVTIILVGNTNIKNGITTTTFASNPDVPISRFSLDLPRASNSLLGANGSLCKPRLYMPLVMTGQNGKTVRRKVRMGISGCLPITRHRARGQRVRLTIKTPAAGRIHVSGKHLKVRVRNVRRARRVTINVPLTRKGRAVLRYIHRHRRHRRMTIRVRVGFTQHNRRGAAYTSWATVVFPR